MIRRIYCDVIISGSARRNTTANGKSIFRRSFTNKRILEKSCILLNIIYTFVMAFLPNKPDGLMRRTMIRMRNAMASRYDPPR